MIIVKYNATFSYSKRDHIKQYELGYSLYPSQFWESFGDIYVTLESADNIELIKSNLGTPLIKDNAYTWKIKDKSKDLSFTLSMKYSWFTKFLVLLSPFGIACIITIALVFFHVRLIKKRRNTGIKKYNFWVPLGIIAVCIVFNSVFLLSFEVLEYLTTRTQTGYAALAIFLFIPLILIFYSLIIWRIDVYFKNKYLQSPPD